MFGPHVTNLGRGRAFSPRHVAYYARRAAGGAGVIVTEVASVHDSDWPYERAPLAVDAVAGWAAIVRACRPHGALVLAGLGHAGGQGSSAYHQQALWAPSRLPDPVSREVPTEMEDPEIDALVAGFAEATALAVEADLDGVEIDAGQHSLLRQFLSGLTNHRTDAHRDGSVLLRAVLDAVRAALGDDRVLGLRLCCDELAPWAGITPDAIATVVAALDVDYLVPVRGSALSVDATRPDLHTAPGFNRVLCARVGGTVLQGSVVDPAMAQAALDDGTADLVEMTRAQITDPDLVAHVRAGTPGRIRPCTLSGLRTAVRDPRNALVSDDAEPGAGYETVDPPLDVRDPHRRDVLVVGGGPAGLEAARTLALRGHRVRLVEREPVLGGALRWAAALPGRSRFGLLIPWWERELARLGVRVTTGVEVGVDDLVGDVALATGSRPAPVLDAAQLLAGAALPPGPVLVDDTIGDAVGVGIAEFLAAAGRDTTLVTPDPVAGSRLTVGLAAANARLDRAGVRRELLTRLRGVQGGWASVEHVWTGVQRTVPCAAVIDCGPRLPDDTLWRARPDLPRAGDCVAPRTLSEAVLEGRRVAYA